MVNIKQIIFQLLILYTFMVKWYLVVHVSNFQDFLSAEETRKFWIIILKNNFLLSIIFCNFLFILTTFIVITLFYKPSHIEKPFLFYSDLKNLFYSFLDNYKNAIESSYSKLDCSLDHMWLWQDLNEFLWSINQSNVLSSSIKQLLAQQNICQVII